MIKFNKLYLPSFEKDLKNIKSNFKLQKRLKNKIEEIVENPYHYKPLRNVLRNRRRVHIGSYVLIFEINVGEKTIIFHTFSHHDQAYD
jgi:YafQ family addiction module toxin component